MRNQFQETEPLVVLNVPTSDGELLGRITLDDDDLRHPASIGRLVLAELPADLRP